MLDEECTGEWRTVIIQSVTTKENGGNGEEEGTTWSVFAVKIFSLYSRARTGCQRTFRQLRVEVNNGRGAGRRSSTWLKTLWWEKILKLTEWNLQHSEEWPPWEGRGLQGSGGLVRRALVKTEMGIGNWEELQFSLFQCLFKLHVLRQLSESTLTNTLQICLGWCKDKKAGIKKKKYSVQRFKTFPLRPQVDFQELQIRPKGARSLSKGEN